MNNVSKTIGWAEMTWNPVSGCKNDCWYCYGKRIRQRFNPGIPWDQIMTFDERLEEPIKRKKPTKIFVGSMTDLFASWMPRYHVRNILETVKKCPQHTFQFLTKNFKGYSGIALDFPDNCWLGYTITKSDRQPVLFPEYYTNQFLSCEPLLGDVKLDPEHSFGWIIVGAMTGQGSTKHQPDRRWVDNILRQADLTQTPVYMKSNLKTVWKGELRQEWPAGSV